MRSSHIPPFCTYTGCDLVDIQRFSSKLRKREEAWLARLLSEDERKAYQERFSSRKSLGDKQVEYLAARFAAKEAVSKALQTGFTQGLRLQDIQIFQTKEGAPFIVLKGKAKDLALERAIFHWSLSLTHENTMAMAVVHAIAWEEKHEKP